MTASSNSVINSVLVARLAFLLTVSYIAYSTCCTMRHRWRSCLIIADDEQQKPQQESGGSGGAYDLHRFIFDIPDVCGGIYANTRNANAVPVGICGLIKSQTLIVHMISPVCASLFRAVSKMLISDRDRDDSRDRIAVFQVVAVGR